jgi:HSP20 family protein
MYPLTTLFNALDTAFEGSLAAGARPACGADRMPRADILEGEKDYRIVIDMPGVRNSDLEISLEGDILSIKAERSAEVPEGYQARRRESLDKIVLRRSFTLGSAVETDSIQADLQAGVLTLSLPKSQKTLPRRIEVK